jgi:hypothetical protein
MAHEADRVLNTMQRRKEKIPALRCMVKTAVGSMIVYSGAFT